jgi:hypothetical protein
MTTVKTRWTVLLFALLALAMPATASAVSATDARQWSVGDRAPSVNTAYPLKSLVSTSHLRYGSRTFGIDLVWGSRSAQWRFVPKPPAANVRDHRVRPLTAGQPVAIYSSTAKAYLVHGMQSWGIDLKWSKTPGHQWKVGVDPVTGAMSLYNTVISDYLVYGQRSFGVNLRWLKDVERDAAQTPPASSVRDATVWMRAQQVIEGYVPFVGQFGGGVSFDGALLKVSNPAGGAPLLFVKPGYSTEQCGNPSAVTYLAPGTTMTSAQMTALWGSAQPSLKNAIPFVACAATNASTVFVNIQYRLD